MRFRTLALVGLLLFALFDARADDSLPSILNDVRSGRVDVCRDARWLRWRFDDGKAGAQRLVALAALASDERGHLHVETLAGAIESARLSALQNIIDAVMKAPNRTDWLAVFARTETAYLNWRARAAMHAGDGFSRMLKRRTFWSVIAARNAEKRIQDPVGGGIGDCLVAEARFTAAHEVVGTLTDMLDRGRYPNDAMDGPGAANAGLTLPDTLRGVRYVSKNWERLSGGFVPAGVLPLWRVYSGIRPESVTSAEAFAQHFEVEWLRVEQMLQELPAPLSVGEELYRRTRHEQFGRLQMGHVSKSFPHDPKRSETLAAMWRRISAVDVINTARVKELLRTRDWFDDERDGEGAESWGFLIVQHSDLEPAFQREVLDRMEPHLATGRVRKRSYAYLWDRVAIAEKRRQRYGSQYTCKDGKWELSPTEDTKTLDARRRRMGLDPVQMKVEGPCG